MDLAPDNYYYFFPCFISNVLCLRCWEDVMAGSLKGGLSSVNLAVLFKSCFFCLIWPSMCHLLLLMDPDPLCSHHPGPYWWVLQLVFSFNGYIWYWPENSEGPDTPNPHQRINGDGGCRAMPPMSRAKKAALEHAAKTAVDSLLAHTMCVSGRQSNSPLPQGRGSLYLPFKTVSTKQLFFFFTPFSLILTLLIKNMNDNKLQMTLAKRWRHSEKLNVSLLCDFDYQLW